MIKLDKDILKRTEQELKRRTTYKDLTVHGYKIKGLPVVKDDYSPVYLASGEVYEQVEREIRKEQNKRAINTFSKWMERVAQNHDAVFLLVVIQGAIYDRLFISPESKVQLRKSIRDFIKTSTESGVNTSSVLEGFVIDAGPKCYYFDVETKRIVSVTDFNNIPQLKGLKNND